MIPQLRAKTHSYFFRFEQENPFQTKAISQGQTEKFYKI